MKDLLKQPGLRGMRAAELATSLACAAASAAASASFVLPTELRASVRMSALRVALDTAASLIALLAAFLVVGRFARRTAASEITEPFNIERAFDSVPDVRLSQDRAAALVRIACEALTNAARHSGASVVRVTLIRDEQWVRLRVSDAGCGFDPDATGWLRPHLAQGTWPLGGRRAADHFDSRPWQRGRGGVVSAVL